MESNEALWKFKMKRDFTAQRGLWGVFFFFFFFWFGSGLDVSVVWRRTSSTIVKNDKKNKKPILASLFCHLSSIAVVRVCYTARSVLPDTK